MAKKTKDAAATEKKAAKPKAPVDPVKTKNLVHLLNILALLLAVTAFLLQLFAVLSHHWKWQATDLQPIVSPTYHYSQPNIYNDSQLYQTYGLYSRQVKIYANNDEQLDLRASTRFPRIDDGENNFHYCLSQTSTLRGAFLTCSNRVVSPEQCHCRRYLYWKFVISFELLALILLGIVVFLTALLTTQFHGILKPAAAGLSLLAFILLLVGLILILTHLKRETHSFADAYPHIYQQLGNKLGVVYNPYQGQQSKPTALRRALRRQTHEFYRLYPLVEGQYFHNDTHFREYSEQDRAWVYKPYSLGGQYPYNTTHFQEYSEQDRAWVYKPYPLVEGQFPYNATHFQEYSEQARAWVYKPYSSIILPASYVPFSKQRQQGPYIVTSQQYTTAAPVYNKYGPLIGYDTVFDNTHAGIGWSTILSIIALVLALLLPLILIFSWLTGKKLASNVKTVTKTVKTEYVPVPQEATIEPVPSRPIPFNYDPQRPIGDAVVTTHNVQQGPYDSYSTQPEPVIVRDVIIRDEQPLIQST